MTDIRIKKDDLATVEAAEPSLGQLADGAARLKIDAFALTANNVTYAAFGEAMKYWDFFPAPEGWGRAPVWGFAEVRSSNADGVEPGRRVYGYFPMSDTLDVAPGRVDAAGFTDTAAHRQPMAAIYNRYSFTDADPAYDPDYEPEQMLFRPLYATGWWAADRVVQANLLDAVVLSSASSKTALALAHRLKALAPETKRIGVTSERNLSFLEATGLYDNAVVYRQASTLRGRGATAYVDFRGDPELGANLHEALGDGLKLSLAIGATDWSNPREPVELKGPAPEFFFVPDYAAKRIGESGPALGEAMNADLRAFYPVARDMIRTIRVEGPEALQAAWNDLLVDRVPADTGLIGAL